MTAATTLTPTEFLLARLADDEAAAQNELDHGGGPTWWGDWLPEHVARHDPARVLAQVAALRAVVELHESDQPYCSSEVREDTPHSEMPTPCDTLLALCQPFADHPDFAPAWLAS